MTPTEILDLLDPPQRAAVELLRYAIGAYGGHEGTGLFSGMERYHHLEARAQLAAVAARDLPHWWSRLLAAMQWPAPPARDDARVLGMIHGHDDAAVLAALQERTASLLPIARLLASADRDAARTLRAEQATLAAAPAGADLDDPIPEEL